MQMDITYRLLQFMHWLDPATSNTPRPPPPDNWVPVLSAGFLDERQSDEWSLMYLFAGVMFVCAVATVIVMATVDAIAGESGRTFAISIGSPLVVFAGSGAALHCIRYTVAWLCLGVDRWGLGGNRWGEMEGKPGPVLRWLLLSRDSDLIVQGVFMVAAVGVVIAIDWPT